MNTMTNTASPVSFTRFISPARRNAPAVASCTAAAVVPRPFGGLRMFMLALAAMVALATLTACSASVHNYSASDEEISFDLAILPQDLAVYAGTGGHPLPPDGVSPDTPLLSHQRQQDSVERALKRFYSPWEKTRAEFKQRDAMWAMYALKPERGFIENLRPYPPERWEALKRNSSVENFPNSAMRAIAVRRIDLRLMPTHSPYFFDPARAGQGYPFDYFQNSSLPAGSPVFISHISRDRAWALVEAPSASGWVDLRDLAVVDDDFIREWRSLPLAAITSENVSIVLRDVSGDASGKAGSTSGNAQGDTSRNVSRGTAPVSAKASGQVSGPSSSRLEQVECVSIGTLLPVSQVFYDKRPDSGVINAQAIPASQSTPATHAGAAVDGKPVMLTVLFPLRGSDGSARIASASLSTRPFADNAQSSALPSTQSSARPSIDNARILGDAALWPLPADRRHIAELGGQMLAQPYGWGGYGGNRDCSSTMRDLFLPFGLWLPRNSGAQAKIGEFTDLSGLPPASKEEAILLHGKPFLTTVSMPGHIGLYLGVYETAAGERALLFHNVWGLRTKNGRTMLQPAREGRAIIGKAVVTTLTPGQERKDIGTPNSLLDRITGMSIIAVE